MRLFALSALVAAALCSPDVAAQERSAINAIADVVAARFAKAPRDLMVLSKPLDSDVEALHADALAGLLVKKVSHRIGDKSRGHDKPVDVDTARKTAAAAPAFILLSPRVVRGRLSLDADLYPVPSTVWARAASPKPSPVVHARAQAPLDAEIGVFLKPVAFGEAQVSKFDGADPDVTALACGDLDGDGVSEIVTVTRQRVLLVSLVDGKVERKRAVRWADLAPVAPIPLRQPLGFATIVEPIHAADRRGYLDVSISDRAGSARLDQQLALRKRLRGKAVPSGHHSACTWLFDLRLGDKLVACDEKDTPPALAALRHRSDTIASTFLVSREGDGKVHVGLRKGSALVVRNADADATIGRVGAQLAIADLDRDGTLEMVTTMDVMSRKHDKLDVRTLLADGTVKRRFNVAVPSGVEAVAACPADGAGRSPVVLASAGQLWVVR